jgi:integrase
MSSVKVVLYTSKKLKNGEHPIMLRVTKDRKPKYISLGVSCKIELWDEDNNLPKKKHPLFKEILILIDKKKIEANRLLLGLEGEDKSFSSEEVKNKLVINKLASKTTVLKYFDETIENLKLSGRIGYAKVFKNTKNSLISYRKGIDFYFSDITTSFLTKYENDFYSRGVTPNAVFVFLRTFKTLVNYAKRDGIVRNDFDPYKDISFSKFRRIKTQKRAISKEEIRKIANLQFEPESSLFHSRNFFLFSYYCRGINFIDMANLTWRDLSNGRLQYTRRKTKELFNISLLEPASEILSYYRRVYYNTDEDYIFPILNKDLHQTATSMDNRIHKILRRTNEDLREIAKLAGINTKITTYVARHSFATVMKKSGIPTAIISEAMGHDSEKTTQIYLDNFDNDIIDKATSVLL